MTDERWLRDADSPRSTHVGYDTFDEQDVVPSFVERRGGSTQRTRVQTFGEWHVVHKLLFPRKVDLSRVADALLVQERIWSLA